MSMFLVSVSPSVCSPAAEPRAQLHGSVAPGTCVLRVYRAHSCVCAEFRDFGARFEFFAPSFHFACIRRGALMNLKMKAIH